MEPTFVSDCPLVPPAPAPAGFFETVDGERFYRIDDVDAMPPFFMSLVSDSDHWLFLSSNGALTAGRRDPDGALFPYYADDRIHDSQDQTGGKTLLRVGHAGRTSLWEPFSTRHEGLYRIQRSLSKSVFGHRIRFEEVNHDLGLAFRCEWTTSERFGFLRHATLRNLGPHPLSVSLVDGLQNALPSGLGRRFQLEFSTLGDGYKRTELLESSGLALFRLSSIPVDKAEPCEALRVNAAWAAGLDASLHLLCVDQLGAFRQGRPLRPERDVRGRRGAYLLHADLDLPPGGIHDWFVVADVDLDAVDVMALDDLIQTTPDLPALLREDAARGARSLARRVAAADGLQATSDERSDARHISNTLFNLMRGGIPGDGYRISRQDLQAFLAKSNQEVAASYDDFLASLPDGLDRAAWLERIAACDDPDLERLLREYLPLTFSRRHGDPSRPWNIFSIQVRQPDGTPIYAYQGNWRDIFQNWEALACSFPGLLEGMVFKFLDATTADGHNPYRVLREGFEWETIDPHDPWSFIGYWGDHQVVYLLRLLEASERYQPGVLAGLMGRRLFTYADVPYRLKPYGEMLADPRSTIVFDQAAHAAAMARAERLGADGKLLEGPGGLARANLAEKLLVVALTKLANFIPGAGLWMNTQRPEWNDANNALVGYGVSVVTLAHLRAYLAFCRGLFAQAGEAVEVSSELGGFFGAVAEVLGRTCPEPGAPLTDPGRKAVLDALGTAASAYRAQIYARGFSGLRTLLPLARVQDLLAEALRHLDHTLRANRREDGLYHAYNLMKVAGDGIRVRRLYPMLEGQVAVLASGLLDAAEAADLLDALKASPLRRADLGTYLLYPDRPLPGFLAKNRLPEDAEARSELLRTLVRAGDTRLVRRDRTGRLRFQAGFRNQGDLEAALDALAATPYGALAARERALVLDLYEEVFDHQSFTGRSGAFYKYEGLGCTYWHMVSKLRLAIEEVRRASLGADPMVLARLGAHAADVQEGLGVHSTPARYGAIPTDPYSHTPSFAGAQQPGMTGQVKEDFLARFLELGVEVQGGRLGFEPRAVAPNLFLDRSVTFAWIDGEGRAQEEALRPGSLAFTLCQVLVVLHRDGGPEIRVTDGAGARRTVPGLRLDGADSRAVFQRSGALRRLDVHLGL